MVLGDLMRELCNEIVQKLSIVMEDLELEENKWQNLLGNSTDKKHGDITLPCHTFSKIFRLHFFHFSHFFFMYLLKVLFL